MGIALHFLQKMINSSPLNEDILSLDGTILLASRISNGLLSMKLLAVAQMKILFDRIHGKKCRLNSL